MNNNIKKNEIELSNGKILKITLSPSMVCFKLLSVITSEFIKNGINIDVDIKQIKVINGQIDKASFIELINKNVKGFAYSFMSVCSSEEVLRQIMICGERCTIDKEKVSLDYFDEDENRGIFFEVLRHIAKRSLMPFFPWFRTPLTQTNEKPIEEK